jgi:hypothetical protein
VTQELDRARAAVTKWRDQHPAGTSEDLIAAIGWQFPGDSGRMLRAVLVAVDRHRSREITGNARPSGGR